VHIIGLILFCLILVLGIVAILLGLPGTFIIFGDALVYGLITRFRGAITVKFLLVLLGITLFAELMEFFLANFTTLKFGASKWGVMGTLAGGILGAAWGSAVLPLVGTLIGAITGAFLGAFIMEYLHREDRQRAAKAGFGALVGKILGIAITLSCAIAMITAILIRLL
jgi:uncharacterized protein YqgC (DUF456 family)